MSDNTTLACGECDKAVLTSLSGNDQHNGATHDYLCGSCGAKLDSDDVVERPPKQEMQTRANGLARRLEQLDPDAVSGGGS